MYIYYTGVGCKHNYIHTSYEFIMIMNQEFTYRTYWTQEELNELEFHDYKLPNEFSLLSIYDWVEFSGAEIINKQ